MGRGRAWPSVAEWPNVTEWAQCQRMTQCPRMTRWTTPSLVMAWPTWSAAHAEVAGVPARRAAVVGRRDGHRPGRAGAGRGDHGGRPRRGRLSVGAGLSRGARRLRVRTVAVVGRSRHDAPHHRRDDRHGEPGQLPDTGGRGAGDHDSCVSAVPGAADGHPACGTACLADRVRPAGPRRRLGRLRRQLRHRAPARAAAVQPAQPDRGGAAAASSRSWHSGPASTTRR